MFLVILDGVNRAPAESYLLPLLACYLDAQRGITSRTLPLFHEAAVSPDDPYIASAQLRWPKNVLLTGTVADGRNALTLPNELWGSTCLIKLDEIEPAEARDLGDGMEFTTGAPVTRPAEPLAA